MWPPHTLHTHTHTPRSYDALVARFPEDWRGYLAKGVWLRDKGRRADAERMFLQVWVRGCVGGMGWGVICGMLAAVFAVLLAVLCAVWCWPSCLMFSSFAGGARRPSCGWLLWDVPS